MLVLSRKKGQEIVIDNNITLKILDITSNYYVKLGFEVQDKDRIKLVDERRNYSAKPEAN